MNRRHLYSHQKVASAIAVSAAIGTLFAPIAMAGGDNSQADIFSTPDSQNPPTFAGRTRPVPNNQPPDPLFGPGGDPPGRDAIRAIPSITGSQLKELDDIINHNRDAITPLQQEVASLKRIQDQRKSSGLPGAIAGTGIAVAPDLLHRDSGMMSMMEASSDAGTGSGFSDDSDESIKARMDSLNQQIGEIRQQQWPQIRSMLNQQQISQLQQMRNGRLLIASTSATDVPEPPPDKPPAPKPALRTPMMPPILRQAFPGAPPVPVYPPRPIAYPPARQPSLVRPLIYTTKQLIYRNLWRLY